ncbi:MAG: N-6 DNA methylase [bacterium]|nr:N-6 DNA methylase [bacterium]
MSSTNRNERSWGIQIITFVENVSKSKNYIIKKAGGEETISEGKKKMFPDVLLFADEEMTNILQGWELKMPDVDITNDDFIKDAFRKANNLGLNSTFIWNFRCGVLYIKNEHDKFEEKKRWNLSNLISKDRNDVYLYQNQWKEMLESALKEINIYLSLGKYRNVSIGEALSTNVIVDLVSSNKSLVAQKLKNIEQNDLVFKNFLDIWWSDAETEYSRDELDKYNAYSKIIIINWLNKIIFSNIFRRENPNFEIIMGINDETTIDDALNIYSSISDNSDFYPVFSKLEYQNLIDENTWNYLKEIHLFLIENGTNVFSQEDIQYILENIVHTSNRVITGLFTTPNKLAEFMVKATIDNIRNACYDPCCGSGTIPKNIINYKKSLHLDTNEVFSSVYESDKFSFPLQLTTTSLTNIDTFNVPLNIFKKDIFYLNIGDTIHIKNPSNGSDIKLTIKEFDNIISNLPFIDFNKNNFYREERESIANLFVEKIQSDTSIIIDYRSDYSFLILFKIYELLKLNGKACIIISNSWMGTQSGEKFMNALRYYFHIENVFISSVERWFKNSKVVTTVLIIKKKEIAPEADDYVTSFGKFNLKLDEINEENISKMAQIALTKNDLFPELISLNNYSKKIIDDYVDKFHVSINSFFANNSWLDRFKDLIIPITDYFDSFPGIKSGDDNLFYSREKDKVDEIFYSRMLKNTRDCNTYFVDNDYYVINCNLSYEQLLENGYTKTYNYFKSKENGLTQSVESHGEIWWKIPQIENKAEIFTALAPSKKIFFGKLKEPTIVNQRVLGYSPKKNVNVELCHALLNSIFSIFMVEAMGFGRGEGVLDLNRTKLANIVMLNPDLISENDAIKIVKLFKELSKRDILDVENEILQEDRIQFDRAVLCAYGLEGIYEEIINSILELRKIRFCVNQ